MIPTFYNGQYHGQLQIRTNIVFNDLVGIKEVESTVELTFDLIMEWKDNRFAMNGFWENIPMGFIDLSTLLTNDSVTIWRPMPSFPDLVGADLFSYDYRFNEYNEFFFQQSYHMTLVQPQFDFRAYPGDSQTINVRFSDAEFATRQLIFVPTNIRFTTLQDGSVSFQQNPIWTVNSNGYTAYVDDAYSNSYNVFYVDVTRRAYGVVIRLVLPMALLILLGAITFWVSYDQRVDTTITILLAMSALYIVILSNIPLVGYLTNVDKFVFWMYFMLVLVAVLHQMYATLNEKLDRWPLRLMYLRVIELAGRVFVLPAVSIYFAEYIPISSDKSVPDLIIILSTLVSFSILVRELFGLRSAFYECMRKLTEKINNPELRVEAVSFIEAFAMNMFFLKTFSFTKVLISQHLHKYGDFPIKARQPLHLRNLSSLMSLIDGQNHDQTIQHRKGSVRKLRLSKIGLFGPDLEESEVEARLQELREMNEKSGSSSEGGSLAPAPQFGALRPTANNSSKGTTQLGTTAAAANRDMMEPISNPMNNSNAPVNEEKRSVNAGQPIRRAKHKRRGSTDIDSDDENGL